MEGGANKYLHTNFFPKLSVTNFAFYFCFVLTFDGSGCLREAPPGCKLLLPFSPQVPLKAENVTLGLF